MGLLVLVKEFCIIRCVGILVRVLEVKKVVISSVVISFNIVRFYRIGMLFIIFYVEGVL